MSNTLLQNCRRLARFDETDFDESKHPRDAFGRFSGGAEGGVEHKKFEAAAIRVQKTAKEYVRSHDADKDTIAKLQEKMARAQADVRDLSRFSDSASEHQTRVHEYVRKAMTEHETRRSRALESESQLARDRARESEKTLGSYEKELKLRRAGLLR